MSKRRQQQASGSHSMMEPTLGRREGEGTEDLYDKEKEEEEEERLQECYHAFLARRVARGGRSIRTRRGYEQLRANYQPRVRFLLDQIASEPSAPNTSDGSIKDLVGPYVDRRVLQIIADECWPLAHFGPRDADNNIQIPEWQELGASRYYAVMVNILLWMFPGLPSFELQELMERDWQNDRDFDAYGNEGLSFEGFAVSLIDLAVACTNGNADRCLEFLRHLADRLHASLTPVHDHVFDVKQSGSTGGKQPTSSITAKQLRWHTIPLNQLVPCKPRQKPRYYELKAKASASPMVLMVLAGNEKPFEFQLSSSAKLLARERDGRTSIRRKTIALKTHLVEMEKQILWTLRDWGGTQPSVFLIPSTCISRRTLRLYGCLRLLDSHEQQLHLGTNDEVADSKRTPTPIFTVYTSIQGPNTLVYCGDESVCGRVDQQGSQLFILDHRERSEAFVVTLKTSLLQSTNSGGGAGAVVIISQSSAATTKMTIDDTIPGLMANSDTGQLPHTFVFVVKDQNEFATPNGSGVHRQTGALPQQWYCAMSAADEEKQIVVQSPANRAQSARGLYYLYIFSLHGVYFDVSYGVVADDGVSTSGDAVSSGHNRRSSQEIKLDSSQYEEDEEDEHKEISAVVKDGPSSGAALLRCLLRLRQKRKKKAQETPLPEFIEGTKVNNTKALTAAVTLRSKFLRAREMARRARVVEREKAFADGLMELAMKHNASFKRSRQPPSRTFGSANLLARSNSSDQITETDDVLETQVHLLASFFREMAVHVPPEGDASDESGAIDEKLMDQFSELFEHDTKLRNILDEEKWLPDEERSKQAQVRGNAIINNKADESEPAHDDYINTARYIESLMRDVTQQEQGDDSSMDTEKQLQTSPTDPVEHLQTSWIYAQLCSGSKARQQRQMEAQKTQLELVRREEWMKSHHVTDLASQARHAAASSPTRAPMSVSKTTFDNERRDLPWNPVWEVIDASTSETGCLLPQQGTEPPPRDAQRSPKRPLARPKTTSTMVRGRASSARTYESDKKVPARDTDTAAVSASFAYAHRLRLDRVRTAGPSREERRTATHSAPPSRPPVTSPQQETHPPPPINSVKSERDIPRIAECEVQIRTLDHLDPASYQNDPSSESPPPAIKVDEVCLPTEVVEPSRRKRARRKTHESTSSSIRRRTNELLEISKAVVEQSRMDTSSSLAAATADFPFPARSKLQSKSRRQI